MAAGIESSIETRLTVVRSVSRLHETLRRHVLWVHEVSQNSCGNATTMNRLAHFKPSLGILVSDQNGALIKPFGVSQAQRQNALRGVGLFGPSALNGLCAPKPGTRIWWP